MNYFSMTENKTMSIELNIKLLKGNKHDILYI